MLHIYYGDGKGKTTAAMGLAMRALGHEKHVTILQFLKGRFQRRNRNAASLRGRRPRLPEREIHLADDRRREDRSPGAQTTPHCAKRWPRRLIAGPRRSLRRPAVPGLVDESLLQQAAALAGQGKEVVFTGRNPLPGCWNRLTTRPRCAPSKHPYSKGCSERRG